MDVEMTIGGAPAKFRTVKLDARKQFHVARRLGPVLLARFKGLAAMASALGIGERPKEDSPEASAADEAEKSGLTEDVMLAGFLPIADAISKLSEKDADYILDACLSVCTRLQGPGYAPVMAPNGAMMFADIGMPQMVQLINAVVKESLGDFFPDPLESATAQP